MVDEKKISDVRVSFFIMPTVFFKSLRALLEGHLGEEKSSEILYQCGYECSKTMTRKMGITHEDHVDIGNTLIALWIEIGLGRLQIIESTEDEIVIHCDDSTEALSMGNVGRKVCDLTRGYLAGIVTTLMDRDYVCYEDKCMGNGDDKCIYRVVGK